MLNSTEMIMDHFAILLYAFVLIFEEDTVFRKKRNKKCIIRKKIESEMTYFEIWINNS